MRVWRRCCPVTGLWTNSSGSLREAHSHRYPIVAKFQEAELDYLVNSEAGMRMIAENYVGLALNFGE